jgi:alkanesulfonate monooxygenase SsuD/methylene tetrahydromethanopterin reductase-like flavin-dependent oxidoreductase (luciferase family)
VGGRVTRPDPLLGVRLPNSGPFAEPQILLDVAAQADRLGFDRVWVHDHISWARDKLTHFATGSLEACGDQDPNFFESVSTIGLLLGRFPRIGVGIAGLVLPLRDPRILGRQLVTLERLGGSRIIAALAIGNIRGDFAVMGVPFERRGRITSDHLGALRAMLRPDQPVSFESETVSFADGTFLPRPERLPLWVTASSEAGLKRAARFADGWLTVYQGVEAYRGLSQQLDALAADAGRDPASLDRGYETYVCVARTHEEAVAIARRSLEGKFETLERGLEVCIVGDAAEALEQIAAYADAGARHLELKFIAHDPGMLAEQVARVAEAAGLSPVGVAGGSGTATSTAG